MPFVPNFKYILVDLSKIDSISLQQLGNAFLVAAVLAFKNAHNPSVLVKQLENISQFLEKSHSRNLVKSFFVYFNQVVGLSREKIINLYQALPPPIKSDAMSTHDIILEEGIKIGQKTRNENATVNLIKEEMPNDFICRVLEVSNEFVEKLRKKVE